MILHKVAAVNGGSEEAVGITVKLSNKCWKIN